LAAGFLNKLRALSDPMSEKPHVLLIDDDPAMHRAVEFRLRGVAEVTACVVPEEALLQIKQKRFDAALVDVALGD
jgi:CheY-like chemotaxis protein